MNKLLISETVPIIYKIFMNGLKKVQVNGSCLNKTVKNYCSNKNLSEILNILNNLSLQKNSKYKRNARIGFHCYDDSYIVYVFVRIHFDTSHNYIIKIDEPEMRYNHSNRTSSISSSFMFVVKETMQQLKDMLDDSFEDDKTMLDVMGTKNVKAIQNHIDSLTSNFNSTNYLNLVLKINPTDTVYKTTKISDPDKATTLLIKLKSGGWLINNYRFLIQVVDGKISAYPAYDNESIRISYTSEVYEMKSLSKEVRPKVSKYIDDIDIVINRMTQKFYTHIAMRNYDTKTIENKQSKFDSLIIRINQYRTAVNSNVSNTVTHSPTKLFQGSYEFNLSDKAVVTSNSHSIRLRHIMGLVRGNTYYKELFNN